MVLSVCRRPSLSPPVSSLLLLRGPPQMPRHNSPTRYFRSDGGGPPTPKHPASAEGAPSEPRYRRMQHGASSSSFYDRHLAQGPPVRSPPGGPPDAWCPGGGPPWSEPGPPPYPLRGRGADTPWALMPSSPPPSAWMWGPPPPYLDGSSMLAAAPPDYMYPQGPPMWGAPSRGPSWSWNTHRPRWSHHHKGSGSGGSRSGLQRQAYSGIEQQNAATATETSAAAAAAENDALGTAGDEEATAAAAHDTAAAAAAAAASIGEGAVSFQQKHLQQQQQLDREQQEYLLQQESDLSMEQQVQQQHTLMQLQQLHFQQQQLEMYWQQQQHMQWYWQQQQQQQPPQPQLQQQQQQQKVMQVIPEAAGRRWMPVMGRASTEVPLAHPGPPPPAGYQTPGGPPAGAPVEEGHWRIMTFNILADSLIDDKYSKQDPQLLAWPRRQQAILDEILLHCPSVICLQELEQNHLQAFAKLKEKGYTYRYKQLTSNVRVDGCAIFWKSDLFRLVDCVCCEYNFKDNSIMDKDQVALLLLLEELPRQPQVQQQEKQEEQQQQEKQQEQKQEEQQQQQEERHVPRLLVAATTHLLFSPARGDVKLAQLLCLFSALHALRLRALLVAYEHLTNSRGSLLMLKTNDNDENCPSNNPQTSASSSVPSEAAPSPSLSKETPAAAAAAAEGGDKEEQAAAGAGEGAEGEGKEDECIVGGKRLHKTLTCPGAGEETLKETVIAWAASHSEAWRKEAEGLDEEILNQAEALVHLVVCGDFNFTPQSPLYHLVVRGTMNFAALSRAKLSGQFLMASKIYPVRSPGHCFAGSAAMNTPETSRLLTQMPPGSNCGWERGVISLTRKPQLLIDETLAAAAVAAALPDAARQQQQQQGKSKSSQLSQSQEPQQQQQQQKQNQQQKQQHQHQQHLLLQDPSLVRLPFPLKSAYAIPPTDPHWVWRVQKRMADEPRFACGKEGPSSAVKGLWGLASSPPPPSSNSSSSSGNSNKITVGEYLEEPAYTAFHGWQKGCIDYIFFAPKNLKRLPKSDSGCRVQGQELRVIQVYQLPPLLKQGRVGSCPNELWPASDHLSLVADLLPTGAPTGGSSGASQPSSKKPAGAAAAAAAAAAPQAEKQER
ncbi:hypothetical protein Emed_005985 [Eimeria media]